MAFQDFDLITERRKQERQQKIRRRITIAIVSSVAILLVVSAAIGVVFFNQKNADTFNKEPKNAAPKPVVTAEKAVNAVCAVTDYKETCKYSLLKTVKGNAATQPKEILKATMVVVSEGIDEVIDHSKTIKFDTPLKKAAFDDCLELLKDAKEELNSSISTIKGTDLGKISSRMPDINNWLSAVMSYQQTCIDGFPDGEEKATMQKLLKTAKELGSNALAVVSQVSSIFSKLQVPNLKRNLLAYEDGFPTWINQEDRRILKADDPKQTANVTVAKDGSGNYTTIMAALNDLPQKYKGRYAICYIYIKEGVYEENVIVTKKMENITICGDGSQKSIVTGKKNYVDGVPTFQTATFAALGDGFMAQSIGFRNTAGLEKHQAVALRVQADRSIFLNCRMEGYQDTLYAQTHRQFYRSCYITGTVDFIFGDAAAIFQNCMIYVREPMDNQQNIVTAQGRVDKRETTGIVLQNCHILADDKLMSEKAKIKSYLGRPWKEYSRTIIMETEIDDLIQPAGWLEWSGDFALKTLHYAEYNNKGPGSSTSGRVKWPGYKAIKREDALKFTVGPFLQGNTWLKSAQVPVHFGLFS
ncbi:pectinesterase pectinesterase inhibitor 45 [Olea europaea subsp. europaea]|uniref:Pectinesterase n=1 Tax=Olea europaea subsp. europaea TaxID=158383 RepID=A0A8S0U846_OLEEU|nr:pectinesterase pectinesterase inhibitor 45 [Olea europaea subsp. europaea]